MRALDRSGELENTIVIYGSDNGFFYGEHRLTGGKAEPYDEAWRVPFAMRFPESMLDGPPAEVDASLTQMDLTATLSELTGADSCALSYECRRLDGRSFTGILRDPGDDRWARRRAILYELWPECFKRELGIRTARFVYAQSAPECGGRRKVLYDVVRDPHQLHNLARSRKEQVLGAARARGTAASLFRSGGARPAPAGRPVLESIPPSACPRPAPGGARSARAGPSGARR